MATVTSNLSKSVVSSSSIDDASSPSYFHPSEYQNYVHIVPELTLISFASWKRSFTLSLYIRNKLWFINGTIPKPKEDYDNYDA